MDRLNREAMSIPADRLADELLARSARRKAIQEARYKARPEGRVFIGSYMENLGWPELFGFDMNRFLTDPLFQIEQELRQRIFWADNVDDDGAPNTWIDATVGMYFDVSLFGQNVRHQPGGVPEFDPHPLCAAPDLSLVKPYDFRATGQMPQLLSNHAQMKRLAAERFGGKVGIGFPQFIRGPLDIAMQIRGYENLVEDMSERPQFVHDLLNLIVDARIRFRRERLAYLGLTADDKKGNLVADDWVNIPFISPAIFRQFLAPIYRRIDAEDRPVTAFHTCGVMGPVAKDLLEAFPSMTNLDLSGWNDIEQLSRTIEPKISFSVQFKNALVLAGTPQQQCEHLEKIAAIGYPRIRMVCAQAIVKLHPTYEENLARVTAFLDLARRMLGDKPID